MTRFACFAGCLITCLSILPTAVQAEAPNDAIAQKLTAIKATVEKLKAGRDDLRPVADVEIFAKAAEWAVKHNEFYKPEYVTWTVPLIDVGLSRAQELTESKYSWIGRPGSTVLGYYSEIDGSVQPFAVRIPESYDPKDPKRWPLHVELHGRGDTLNELSFLHSHEPPRQTGDKKPA